MPELPDLTIYVEALERRVLGQTLTAFRFASPFVLRSVQPSPDDLLGRPIASVERLGKQIVFGFADDFFCAVHLMIAGRLRWRAASAPLPRRGALAAWDFATGTLLLTEVSKKKRAGIRIVQGRGDLLALDPGGLEPLSTDFDRFRERLSSVNHTLKRALTDPRLLAGIGNAYSDEILLAAQLSPFKQTRDLNDDEWQRLYRATLATLAQWVERLRHQAGEAFPEKVTAFHKDMAVHGRYRRPCPVCRAPVQRIVYAGNEANYCPRCQTNGRILADRVLSRLLKASWPRTLEELEGDGPWADAE